MSSENSSSTDPQSQASEVSATEATGFIAPGSNAASSGFSMPPLPGAQNEELQARIAELEATNKELAEQYLRAQADAQNMRRRADEDMAKTRKFAIEAFAEAMLPVVDSLEAGLAVASATPEQLREGSEATLRQLKAALERSKVLEINPAAQEKFNPNRHQAISAVPAQGQEPGTVVAVLQKGYSIADRVLRPALVTVSQAQG